MARRPAILQSEFPYNISSRSINKEWFKIDMDIVWEIFCEELYMTSIIHDLKVHQFVLMNNHYHMIASTPKANISQCMLRFLGNVSRRLNEAGNRINGNFSGRHYKTILHSHNYFLNAYKYNYINPLEANLSPFAEDYKYSTLAGLLGLEQLKIPLVEDNTLFSDIEGTIKWINKKPPPEKLEAVRYALKRNYFKPKKINKKPLLSDDEII